MSSKPGAGHTVEKAIGIVEKSIVIDYGCGIGRIAKELIKRYGCYVVGVDISQNMRALAVGYVQSNRFFACSPEILDALIERGFAADVAVAVWVLQHCVIPSDDVERIHRALTPEGKLFVLNNIYRAVPTKEADWVNDGIDIKALLAKRLTILEEGSLPEDVTPPRLRGIIFWASLMKQK